VTKHGESTDRSSGPIHIAIIRRVRPGCEAEFQEALCAFFQASFAHGGVLGASMLVPPPGSERREVGILRTFASERDRDDFYESPLFKAWVERSRPLAEDEWESRPLHGLEAWFRSPQDPPSRWKMALLTWIAVWPVTMAAQRLLNALIGQSVPRAIHAGAVSGVVVIVLTWAAMPLLVRVAHRFLQPAVHPSSDVMKPGGSVR
jgi:antibiotic biosynthesis monooxygenase (ABM) superfamily enzyme